MIKYSVIPNADGFIDAINSIAERNLYSIYLDLDNSVIVVKDSSDNVVHSSPCDFTNAAIIRNWYESFVNDNNYFTLSF
jgi:hypothetical protein